MPEGSHRGRRARLFAVVSFAEGAGQSASAKPHRILDEEASAGRMKKSVGEHSPFPLRPVSVNEARRSIAVYSGFGDAELRT